VFVKPEGINYDTVTVEAALKGIKSDGFPIRALSQIYGVPH
jgi:hypothetical protein